MQRAGSYSTHDLVIHYKYSDVAATVIDEPLQIEYTVQSHQRAERAMSQIRIGNSHDAAAFRSKQRLDDDVAARLIERLAL